MRTIYIDDDYMCHLEDAQGRTEIQTDVFDGTVDEAIQFYRYIPQGKEWADSKGRILHGLFVQATDSAEIARVTQQAYISDMQTALEILGVTE